MVEIVVVEQAAKLPRCMLAKGPEKALAWACSIHHTPQQPSCEFSGTASDFDSQVDRKLPADN
jgi:hypothetical protein